MDEKRRLKIEHRSGAAQAASEVMQGLLILAAGAIGTAAIVKGWSSAIWYIVAGLVLVAGTWSTWDDRN